MYPRKKFEVYFLYTISKNKKCTAFYTLSRKGRKIAKIKRSMLTFSSYCTFKVYKIFWVDWIGQTTYLLFKTFFYILIKLNFWNCYIKPVMVCSGLKKLYIYKCSNSFSMVISFQKNTCEYENILTNFYSLTKICIKKFFFTPDYTTFAQIQGQGCNTVLYQF